MMRRVLILLILASILIPSSAAAMSGEEILRRMERNQILTTASGKGIMIIHDRFGERRKTFNFYTKGEEEALIQFTSPDEQGQKILRLKDEIYLYYPDAEEIIRLQGAALRESVAGSDLSYEDLTGGRGLLKKYRAKLLGEEVVDKRPCYKLELVAKVRNLPYPRQILWVDKENFALRKGEYYSLSNRLLKRMVVKKIERIKGRHIPTHMIISDALKKESRTEFIIAQLQIDVPLDDSLFSLEGLSW